MKKAYLSIKFHEDSKNRKLIDDISKSLLESGIQTYVVEREYGKIYASPQELMNITFKLIDNSDMIIIEFSEKGVGIGIEAGYAFSKNIPIFVIAKEGSEISSTLRGISKEIMFYNDPIELANKFKGK